MAYKFIDTIESLAKNVHLREGDIVKATEEILKESAIVLNCERVNAWLFNSNRDELKSLKAFTLQKLKYSVEKSLHSKDLPNYFRQLKN